MSAPEGKADEPREPGTSVFDPNSDIGSSRMAARTSAQIRLRADSATTAAYIITKGWVDTRGKLN